MFKLLDSFRWWSKYYALKLKYEELEKNYNELVNLVDDDFWEWVSNNNE